MERRAAGELTIPNHPYLPDWKLVIEEAHKAGFTGMELGPYTYMPTELDELEPVLEKNEITIMTGTIFDDLVSESNLSKLLEATHEICSLISKLPQKEKLPNQNYAAPYLTVIDFGDDTPHLERDYAAGHPDQAKRLSDDQWDTMVAHIMQICEITTSYGVRPVIHPHAGGFIEFEDELARIVKDIPYELAGLCLDTGHLYYSKMDPEEFLIKYWERVDYIHFKDIDKNKYIEVMNENIRFFDACAEQIMCPIGKGCIDYSRLHELLTNELNYEGFITIEQERDPRDSDISLKDVKQSVDFLRSVGFKQ